jgi:hypothetical protein
MLPFQRGRLPGGEDSDNRREKGKFEGSLDGTSITTLRSATTNCVVNIKRGTQTRDVLFQFMLMPWAAPFPDLHSSIERIQDREPADFRAK